MYKIDITKLSEIGKRYQDDPITLNVITDMINIILSRDINLPQSVSYSISIITLLEMNILVEIENK